MFLKRYIPMNTEHAYIYSAKLKAILLDWGFSESATNYIVDFSALIIVLIGSIIFYMVLRYIINRFLKRLILRSKSKWDDHLHAQKVLTRLALIVPALIIELFLAPTVSGYPKTIHFIEVVLEIYSIAILALVANSFLNAVYHIYGDLELNESKPIKGYIQIGKIIIIVVGAIVLISTLIGQSPLKILAGLGAISAVLLLIFKDSILGFVAGVQMSSNHMLMIGDWITMEKYHADGIVIDISLVIVKIRNFDNSISTIPTYALITESFQNWRDMQNAGGRRIKRSVLIDVQSIRPVDTTLLEQLKKYELPSDIFKGGFEGMTNLGAFRRYMLGYLQLQPEVNQQMTIMIRLLPPSENGQPVEFYAFILATDVTVFENFQSTLFEHVYSVLPDFNLSVYQRNAGSVPQGL